MVVIYGGDDNDDVHMHVATAQMTMIIWLATAAELKFVHVRVCRHTYTVYLFIK